MLVLLVSLLLPQGLSLRLLLPLPLLPLRLLRLLLRMLPLQLALLEEMQLGAARALNNGGRAKDRSSERTRLNAVRAGSSRRQSL